MALAVFAVTLFVSAFFLFLVQPMIGKMILPRLGGTPQVWNTCMVFFQMVLLLGYFYTHAVSSKIPMRRQLIIHGLLLLAPFAILLPYGPFNIEDWVPTLGANPLISTLILLFAIVGLPFFVVSTSAPLLQRWFGFTGHPAAKDPYFLYGASNLGSLLALLMYPFLIEPWLGLRPPAGSPWWTMWPLSHISQPMLWTIGYAVLVAAVYICIAMVWKSSGNVVLLKEPAPVSEGMPSPLPPDNVTGVPPTPTSAAVTASPPPAAAPAPVPAPSAAKMAVKKGPPPPKKYGPAAAELGPDVALGRDEMTTWRRVRWIGLGAVPVSLMLGVTTHITTDLSPIPLFWLVPLTLYLLSFILVFSKYPIPWVEQPHTFMLYVQPAIICIMLLADIYGGSTDPAEMWLVIGLNVLAFFATALVCHGELAKDRPSTKHLTEFYLLMSFGGMLGGMFNGIVAPIIFIPPYVLELTIAVVAACLLRPVMKEGGWLDELLANVLHKPAGGGVRHKAGQRPAHGPAHVAHAEEEAPLTPLLDYVLPGAVLALTFLLFLLMNPSPRSGDVFFVFGVPLIICAFFFARPLRFGLAIAAVLIVNNRFQAKHDESIYADRSYFGIIRVSMDRPRTYMQLTHGHINHGMNFMRPESEKEWGDPAKDFSRLATTYYHRLSPVGVAMEKYNWVHGPPNTYDSDGRIVCSLAGAGALLGVGTLPVDQFASLWSEPPFATIGLGTGTMASYSRPYQHCHYYEIDNHVRRLNLPLKKNEYYFSYEKTPFSPTLPGEPSFIRTSFEGKGRARTYFTYLKDSINRGSELHVYMGDARLRMALPYRNFHDEPHAKVPPGGPEGFYHLIVVDAFSSDAIPVHLLTREAFQMYFKHMAEEGVLCVHTSNRYVALPLVVAAVANDLKLSWRTGHTNPPDAKDRESKDLANKGRYSSEWVMVARDAKYLEKLYTYAPPSSQNAGRAFWKVSTAHERYVWTDDHSNLMDVLGKRDE